MKSIFLIYKYGSNNKGFANKVTVKIKWLDICKAIIAIIIFGAVWMLLLITALFPKLKMGHNSLSQGLITFINNLVHNQSDDDFHIYMLH